LCGIIYYLRGDVAMEDYFFTLGFTNILCDIGFILFPVAGPMATIGEIYTVPLNGYVWTYLGELMRSQLHYIGGTIPSPHCAAATIMWVMAFRYHRPSFYILTPIILSLYVSTFYCRYHYVTDAVIGIAVAFLALALVPILIKWWDKVSDRQARLLKPDASESRP
jgi:membrane-associated phospholipid phosphatase